MYSIHLAPFHVAAIRGHAVLAYPEECCGVLVGSAGDAGAWVEEILEAANVAPRRRRRYAIDPGSLLFAHRQAREAGREVVGYYHSHPDAAAFPSSWDHQHAWPGVIYLIVEVVSGVSGALRGWRLRGEGKEFQEVALAGALEEEAALP